MKHNFQLADFPNSNFELQISIWTGKLKLIMDNTLVEQGKEKGKPFLITTADGRITKAYPKPSFPDPIPTFEINGKKNQLVEKLKWYEYVIGGLPIVLLFAGGAIGGAIGGLCVMLNFSILRSPGSLPSKYVKILCLIIASFLIYFIIARFFLKASN